MTRWLGSFLTALILAAPTFAQLATNTSIVGKVADTTGAAIHEAQVTARNHR